MSWSWEQTKKCTLRSSWLIYHHIQLSRKSAPQNILILDTSSCNHSCLRSSKNMCRAIHIAHPWQCMSYSQIDACSCRWLRQSVPWKDVYHRSSQGRATHRRRHEDTSKREASGLGTWSHAFLALSMSCHPGKCLKPGFRGIEKI